MPDAHAGLRTFTVAEARELVPAILERAERLATVRADLAGGARAHNLGERVSVADIKAAEARMGELLDGFEAWGLHVVGHAPLLLDFATVVDGEPAWLCWLENEQELDWWHPDTGGFMCRRRISATPGMA